MLEQAIDELMAFVKRRGGRLIFGTDRTVFTEGDSMFIGGKAALLAAMREDSERERHKREREVHKRERKCHGALLCAIVNMRANAAMPHSNHLTERIDASERCLREHDDDS